MRKSSLKLAAVEISMLVLALNLQDLTADSKSKVPDPEPKAVIMEYRTEEKFREVYPAESEAESLVASRDWDAEESYMLMKIAMAEAEGEDTEGKPLS